MTTLMTLTPAQTRFCEWLYKDGHTNPQSCLFGRAYLRSVALKNGMQWAPAWIVKDKSRVTTRGLYSVPELVAYIAMMNVPAQTNSNIQ